MLLRVACLFGICAVAASAGCGGSGLLTAHEQIYLVSAMGGKIRALTSGEKDSLGPAWSPDGKRLAFVQGSGVAVVYRNGRPLARLTSGQAVSHDPPLWSPDGRRLALTTLTSSEGTARIVVVRATGSPAQIVTSTPWGTGDSNRGPVWSPDGRLLTYCLQGPETPAQGGVRASGELDLAVVSSSGTGRRTLTTLPGSEFDPSWSPDGRWILFQADAPNQPGSSGSSLRLVRPDGGLSRLVVRLASAAGASWSPDGKWIAFAGNAPGELRTHLYVVRPDGAGLRRLTGEITADRPVWSPDGKLIAFGTYTPTIDVIAPDGSGRRMVVSVSGADIRGLAWSPDGTTIAFAARKQQPES